MLMSDGIRHIGDGMLEVTEERLKGFQTHQDIDEVYDITQTPFARGKFATVRRARHKQLGIDFAAKFLRRRRRGKCLTKDIEHEIAVLLLCADSKHIVKLHGVHETQTEIALLLEMATGGELQAMIDEEVFLPEEKARICMKSVLQALQYLHKKSIAHLDLKPQNILLSGERVEDGLKLCDFGISRVVEEGGKVREILGTPDYVAPEVLHYEPLSLKTDIWSVGVLAYVLLTGCSPFGGDNKQETFYNISKCALTFPDDLFDNVSSHAIDFIVSVLQVKPNDRMTASECLEHRWLKDETPLMQTITNNDVSIVSTDKHNHQHTDHDSTEHSNENHNDNNSPIVNKVSILTTSTTATATPSASSTDECSNEDLFITSDVNYKNSLFELKIINSIELLRGGPGSDNNNKNNQEEEEEDKENIVTTNYCNKTREMNLIIEEKRDENRLICEKLYISNNNNSLSSSIVGTTPPSRTTTATAVIHLFPDAPTTPKVCRKAPSDISPSVQALVKKFQDCDKSPQLQPSNNNHHVDFTVNSGTTATTTTIVGSKTVRCNCLTSPSCRHFTSRKSIGGIDQGIIC